MCVCVCVCVCARMCMCVHVCTSFSLNFNTQARKREGLATPPVDPHNLPNRSAHLKILLQKHVQSEGAPIAQLVKNPPAMQETLV